MKIFNKAINRCTKISFPFKCGFFYILNSPSFVNKNDEWGWCNLINARKMFSIEHHHMFNVHIYSRKLLSKVNAVSNMTIKMNSYSVLFFIIITNLRFSLGYKKDFTKTWKRKFFCNPIISEIICIKSKGSRHQILCCKRHCFPRNFMDDKFLRMNEWIDFALNNWHRKSRLADWKFCFINLSKWKNH